MQQLSVEVWGDLALFSRPEFKAERVSYDVITPSAARGIFHAIHWKPEIDYQIIAIEVLRPIRWLTIRRNEVSKVASKNTRPLVIEDDRQQRSSLLLRDVRYRLHAHIVFPKTPQADAVAKHHAIFHERLRKGKCAYQPCLGCREFVAYFAPVNEQESALDLDLDLGYMFYDHDYRQHPPQPTFFRAQLQHGKLNVPGWDSPEVRR